MHLFCIQNILMKIFCVSFVISIEWQKNILAKSFITVPYLNKPHEIKCLIILNQIWLPETKTTFSKFEINEFTKEASESICYISNILP